MKYAFMTRTARELQIWHWPEQGLAFGCTVLVFTMLGPFETYSMPLVERALYWILCLTSGWIVMVTSLTLVLRHPDLDEWAGAYRVGLAVIIATVPIALAVGAIEKWFRPDREAIEFGRILLNTAVVCGLIAAVMYFRVQNRIGQLGSTGASPARFLQRLPYELGQDLISFSMQDHYVEVTTSKGSVLILLPLRDALEELGDYDGLQIHRSHWVAASAFCGLARRNGKLYARLSDGRDLPVSRTYAASAQALTPAKN